MSRINGSRVVAGGLLAGLVINIGEFLLNGPIAGEEMEAHLAELGMQMPDAGAIATFVAIGFLAGIVMVWLYAAFRARYGPGPKTALRASLPAWFFGYGIPSVGMYMMGLLTTGLLVIGLVWGLIEYGLAAVAGAWLYHESEAAPEPAASPTAPVIEEQVRREAPAGGGSSSGYGGDPGI